MKIVFETNAAIEKERKRAAELEAQAKLEKARLLAESESVRLTLELAAKEKARL